VPGQTHRTTTQRSHARNGGAGCARTTELGVDGCPGIGLPGRTMTCCFTCLLPVAHILHDVATPNSLLPSKPIHAPHLPSLVAELRAPLLLPTAVSSDRPQVDSSSRPAAPPAPPAPAARTAVAGVNSGQQNMDADRQLPLPHRLLLFLHPLMQLVQPILCCCCCCCCSRHHLCLPPPPPPPPHIPINNARALDPTPEGCRSPPLQAVLLLEPAAAPAAAPRLGDFTAALPAPPAAAAVMRLCWLLCLSGLVWSNLSRSCKLSSVPGSSSS
jgi:hypothetical protein